MKGLRTLAQITTAAGLCCTAASFMLSHFATTRMGVMRDLYARNKPFAVVLDSPAHWGLRLLVLCAALFFIRGFRRTPASSLCGLAASLFWLTVSFTPSLLGLTTPWMLLSLALVIAGCAIAPCTANSDLLKQVSRP